MYMRKHIPDTWAFFFGLVIVKINKEDDIDFTQLIGVEDFINIIKTIPFRVVDEVKYRQRFLFMAEIP